MTNKHIEGGTKALIKIIRLHAYRAFIFWWCFLIRSWKFWYMLANASSFLYFLLQCWHRYRAFFGWLVLMLFSLSTVRVSFLIVDSCCVSFSIFNSSTEENHHWPLLLCFWSFRISWVTSIVFQHRTLYHTSQG